MLPKDHAKGGLLLTLALFPSHGWRAVAAGAAAVLLDVDHYLWFVHRFGHTSLSEAYSYFLKKRETLDRTPARSTRGATFLHSVELTGFLGLLGLRSPVARAAMLGCALHLLLDLYEEQRRPGPRRRSYSLLGLLSGARHEPAGRSPAGSSRAAEHSQRRDPNSPRRSATPALVAPGSPPDRCGSG